MAPVLKYSGRSFGISAPRLSHQSRWGKQNEGDVGFHLGLRCGRPPAARQQAPLEGYSWDTMMPPWNSRLVPGQGGRGKGIGPSGLKGVRSEPSMELCEKCLAQGEMGKAELWGNPLG